MALIGDLVEAKKMWSNSSWFGRALILISSFLAISSIASISENVFKWKGFILDGINFYREFLSVPISNLVASFGYPLDSVSVDYLVLASLGITGMLRVGIVFMVGSKLQKQLALIGLFFLFCIFLCGAIIVLSKIGFPPFPRSYILSPLVVVIILFPVVRKFTSKQRVVYYTPILLTTIVILLLAALNVGLTKNS